MNELDIEPYCNDCPYFEPQVPEIVYSPKHFFVRRHGIACEHREKCNYAVAANENLKKKLEGEQE